MSFPYLCKGGNCSIEKRGLVHCPGPVIYPSPLPSHLSLTHIRIYIFSCLMISPRLEYAIVDCASRGGGGGSEDSQGLRALLFLTHSSEHILHLGLVHTYVCKICKT